MLVTGGAGFVGCHLTQRIVERGDEVQVFDNFFTGRREFLSPLNGALSIFEGDLRSWEDVSRAVQAFRPDIVFHLAALHYIPYCNEHPVETIAVNVAGTETLLQVCQKFEVERFIFASSAAVYPIYDKANVEDAPIYPTDIYGNTKYFGEHLVRAYHERTGTSCSVGRLFNVYGPKETNPHVIPAILDQVKEGGQVLELGNLEPKRDYIFVEDVVTAFLALEEHAADFDTFNIGTGREYSVQELVDIISAIIGRRLSVRQSEARKRKSDRLHLVADIHKIQEMTGWKPEFDLYSGMKRLIEHELPAFVA